MRRSLALALGVFIGQWLAFAAPPSPANHHGLGLAAWERRDYAEALRQWSHGVTLQPGNPLLHYRRATALARLGQPQAAADA
jgi:Flp pilus assembly protein TadD